MEMLFSAKWNVPKAAENCNLSWKEMKITFNEYCAFHPPIYKPEQGFLGTVVELVDTPDLKSVGHYAREGSSPSRPIEIYL